jgi:hypothetical protein
MRGTSKPSGTLPHQEQQLTSRTTIRQRRREALRALWSRGSLVLLSVALAAVVVAFVFYDVPITDNTQIISSLRDAMSSPTVR